METTYNISHFHEIFFKCVEFFVFPHITVRVSLFFHTVCQCHENIYLRQICRSQKASTYSCLLKVMSGILTIQGKLLHNTIQTQMFDFTLSIHYFSSNTDVGRRLTSLGENRPSFDSLFKHFYLASSQSNSHFD